MADTDFRCFRTPPIAIGFASKSASISRAPGWETDSWGYHGDDGNSFASQNVGKPYAEMFGVGDTVGCLINFRLNHALFTKNGRDLGTLKIPVGRVPAFFMGQEIRLFGITC